MDPRMKVMGRLSGHVWIRAATHSQVVFNKAEGMLLMGPIRHNFIITEEVAKKLNRV